MPVHEWAFESLLGDEGGLLSHCGVVSVALSKGATIKLEQYNQPAPAGEVIPGLLPRPRAPPSSLWWAWLASGVLRPSSVGHSHQCKFPTSPCIRHKGCAASHGHRQCSFLGWEHKSHGLRSHPQLSPRAAVQSMRQAYTSYRSRPPHQMKNPSPLKASNSFYTNRTPSSAPKH